MLTARLKKASLLQTNHKETAVQVELGTAGSGGEEHRDPSASESFDRTWGYMDALYQN